MQTPLQHGRSPQPRVFRHSLDWRFLLPMAEEKNAHILFEHDADFSQALAQVGIQPAQQLDFAEFRESKLSNLPLLVMPFGLPRGAEPIEFFSAIRLQMAAGGTLLVGFKNAWYVRGRAASRYFSSTPRRLTYQLKQSGFSSPRMFGAMKNLSIPEYIFDLEPRAVYFALQYRFRRKPVLLTALRTLAGTIGPTRLSDFLPCYFAIANA
jgi:hypothetical protein